MIQTHKRASKLQVQASTEHDHEVCDREEELKQSQVRFAATPLVPLYTAKRMVLRHPWRVAQSCTWPAGVFGLMRPYPIECVSRALQCACQRALGGDVAEQLRGP